MSKKYPQVLFDINIGSEAAGRVVFELFSDLTPLTVENFRALCTGEYGTKKVNGKLVKLHYKESKFHRIIDDFIIQGGDIVNGDGTGSISIYGEHFADENFSRRHACAGLLSMANAGRNTNGSQFFITLKACPHLDGKHTVFGQVIEGMQVVRRISKLPRDMDDRPKIPVVIRNVDQVGDGLQHFRNDPFSQKNLKSKEDQQQQDEEEENKGSQKFQLIKDREPSPEKAVDIQTLEKKKIVSEKTKSRLMELQMKINAAKSQNTKAVLEEERINTDPEYHKQQKASKYHEKRTQKLQQLEQRGLEKNQNYLNQNAQSAQYDKLVKEKKKSTFGWDVFNVDTVYKRYEKRCRGLELNDGQYERQKLDPEAQSIVGVEKLAQDMQKQEELKAKSKKRKKYDEDEKTTYINDRNRMYNQKLDRAFSVYVDDIKTNLEQRTAK